MAKATAQPVTPVVPVLKPGFWSVVSDFFGMATVAIGTTTRVVRSIDNIVHAGEVQSEVILEASIDDAASKRAARLAERKANPVTL